MSNYEQSLLLGGGCGALPGRYAEHWVKYMCSKGASKGAESCTWGRPRTCLWTPVLAIVQVLGQQAALWPERVINYSCTVFSGMLDDLWEHGVYEGSF